MENVHKYVKFRASEDIDPAYFGFSAFSVLRFGYVYVFCG